MTRKEQNQPHKLYANCCWCFKRTNMQDKMLTCGANCPKRPQPVDTYSEDMTRVTVYESAAAAGVDFSVATEFMNDLFRGSSL